MSIFSGKCDLWDSLVMIQRINDDSDWSKIEVYQEILESDTIKNKKLDICSLKDLIPYAPFPISTSISYNGHYRIYISTKSYIDINEKENLDWLLDYLKKRYRSCKRKKVEFIPETEAQKCCFFNPEISLEVAKRIKQHPISANTEGLHLPLNNYFRESHIKAMQEYGYTEDEANDWVFKGLRTWED